MKFTSATGRERLLRTHPTTAQKTFDDLLHSCATTIEDALITSGLEPGVDYKAMDIFALANPLAMKLMHREGAQITVGYPDDHPHAGLRQDHELNEAEKAIMARIIKRPACNKSSLSAWVKTQADNYPLARKLLFDSLDKLIRNGYVVFFSDGGIGDPFYGVTDKGRRALS